MARELGASASPKPSGPTPTVTVKTPQGSVVDRQWDQVQRGPNGFTNLKVTTTESPLSPRPIRFAYLLVFTRANGTTNTDFVLVGEAGAETVDLGVGDSFLFTDISPSQVWCVANSGTQAVYGIGWGAPSGE